MLGMKKKANGGQRGCIKPAYAQVSGVSTYLAGNKPATYFSFISGEIREKETHFFFCVENNKNKNKIVIKGVFDIARLEEI